MHNKSFIYQNEDGISNIIGTMLLLGAAVILFSVVYFSILSTPAPTPSPTIDVVANLVGDEEEFNIEVSHWGGEPVSVDARFFVEIAGVRQPEETLKDHVVNNIENPDYWNFGEQLSFSVGNVSGLKVDMGIADVYSNSLVLLSTLQEGYVVPPFGRGGIWHFNETSGPIAYDSTPNNNHGTIYGAQRVLGVNSTNGLSFDGLDDYVYVRHRPGIDIRGNISVEAWVNASTISDPINQVRFDYKFGYYPNITHVVDEIYAVVYRNGSSESKNIVLKTISIKPDGFVGSASIADVIVDSGGYEPKIIQLSDSTYAVIYGDSNQQGIIKTYEINETGIITDTGYSSDFGVYCEELSICRVTNDVFAIVYGSDGKNPGYIQTVHFSEDGEITLLHKSDSFTDDCADPEIKKLTDELYIVSYIDGFTNKDNLFLKTFTIDPTYNIDYTSYDVSYSENCDDPTLIKISDEVIGVAFTNKSEGVLQTYEISSDGEITFTDNQIVFEEDTCHDPDGICLHENLYAIAYEGPLSHIGKLAKIAIFSNGTIDKIVSIKEYDPYTGITPDVFKISRHIFGIVYREKKSQAAQPGGLATFSFFNDIDFPYQNAGISKENTYTLFANGERVVGGINDQNISTSLTSGWHHIALTYNQSLISLYVDGEKRETVSYSEPLNVNTNPVYIGDYFSGLMDEVAIFDHCLTEDEVKSHYDSPGNFS